MNAVCYRCDFSLDTECTCGRQQVHTQRFSRSTITYARQVLTALDDLSASAERLLRYPLTEPAREVVTSSIEASSQARESMRAILAASSEEPLSTEQVISLLEATQMLRGNADRIGEIILAAGAVPGGAPS